MPEQGNKYNIPHLKVLLEAIFCEMIQAIKKVFIFRQGNCTTNVLHPSLSKSFALSICSRDPMKNSTLEYFCKSTYSQMHCKLHDGSLEDKYCVPFFKLNFLIPTLRHIFCLPKAPKIYEESDFESSVSWSKLGKYTFLWFKKRDFYFLWEEMSEFFQKIC